MLSWATLVALVLNIISKGYRPDSVLGVWLGVRFVTLVQPAVSKAAVPIISIFFSIPPLSKNDSPLIVKLIFR